jgi:hypothetical protein
LEKASGRFIGAKIGELAITIHECGLKTIIRSHQRHVANGHKIADRDFENAAGGGGKVSV